MDDGPIAPGRACARPRRLGSIIAQLRDRLKWVVPICAWNGAFFLLAMGTGHDLVALVHGTMFGFGAVVLGREPVDSLA